MYALVRHAHAGDKKVWAGPDTGRPLSRRGQQQAIGIAGNLQSMPVTRLFSSPARRCVQSLEPLSAKLNTPIVTRDELGPGATVGDLDRLLDDPEMEGAVLCTHGEQLKALMKRWDKQHTLHLPPDGGDAGHAGHAEHSTEKGAAWIVETAADGHTIYYLRPVEVGPSLGDDADTWARVDAV